MRVEPATARYTIEETDSLLRITIPARSSPLSVLMWTVWLGLLVTAGFTSHGAFSRSSDGTIEWFGLVIWSFLAFMGSASLLWLLFGREVITLADGELAARMSLGPLGYTRRYAFAETNSYRVSLKYAAVCGSNRAAGLPLGPGRGTIQFEHGGSTRYLGAGLDETEANDVFALLKPYIDARPRRARALA